MHFPVWFFFAMIALVFWGITGVTQKLSTNAISAERSFLGYAYAIVALGVVLVLVMPLDWHLKARVFWLAVLGGALNAFGVITSFGALEHEGKASIVIPLCYLYPLVTIFLAITFLHENLTRVQVTGIFLALVAAILLSREAT